MNKHISSSVAMIQRVKPNYRVPFFDELGSRCEDGFSLAAGQPLLIESIPEELGLSAGNFTKLNNTYFKDPSHSAFMCYQGGLMEWLRKTDPGALIVEANFRIVSSYAAIRWMKQRRRPVIGWGLGAKAAAGVMGTARNAFLRQFDALIAYSTVGAEEYARTGFEKNNIYVAKNAVIPSPKQLPVHEVIDGRPIRLLFVGRLQSRKNVDRLIRAVAKVKIVPRPMLRIVGDGPEMENLRQIAQNELADTVFTGHLEGEALEREFINADLFVLPGTGGLAVQQAVSYGLPVIVERGDGTQNDLVTRENGWLLDEGSEEELERILQVACATPDQFKALGNRSFEIARDEVNIHKMADVFVEAIEITQAEKLR